MLLPAPAIIDCDVLSLDIARVAQALVKGGQFARRGIRRAPGEKSDHRHRRLLRIRRERPRGSRAAEQRDELAPVAHSITSSARAKNVSGIVRRSALAAVRLTTSSNLVGCWTGMSAGFVPLRILSTKSPARRNWSS